LIIRFIIQTSINPNSLKRPSLLIPPTGAKDMEMRVKVSTSACCLKYNNTANIYLLFKPITDNILEEGMPPLHKFAQKLGIMIEPFPELFWDRKHDMAIPHPGKKNYTYIIYPLIFYSSPPPLKPLSDKGFRKVVD